MSKPSGKIITTEWPKVRKSYYSIDTPNGHNLNFQRHAFKLLDSAKNIVLVPYTGNEAETINFPHRSTIKNTHSFYQALPSYLKHVQINWTLQSQIMCTRKKSQE